jgi:hypothetical protein
MINNSEPEELRSHLWQSPGAAAESVANKSPTPAAPCFTAEPGQLPSTAHATLAGRNKLRAVLPHEWIFGAFLFLTGLRLLIHGGAARVWSYWFLGCWLAGLAVFFWAEQNLTPARWRVRLLFYPAAMGIAFYALGLAVPLLGNPKVDPLLLDWDRALLGETPAVAWEPWLRPWLENLAMVG